MARHCFPVPVVQLPMQDDTLTAKGNLNTNLHQAAKNKNDDFYTQLSDIAEELRHYAPHFKDKVVYCNCDDPKASQFFQYFYKKFRGLGLRKLISTCYKNRNPDLFTMYDQEKAIGITFTEPVHDDDMPNIKIFDLDGDGDFRSEECICLLEKADIVVTNPPFSLFRKYVAQLVEYGKKFLIIGNMNAITYKEIFPLIKDNKIWLGMSPRSMTFEKSDGSKLQVNAVWFTNLDHKKRHEELILGRKYMPEDYPKYDNYDAINVDKVADIPEDYPGAMGVPITFLDKYNPHQFEILNCNNIRLSNSVPVKGHGLIKDKDSAIKGKPKYVRIVIRNKLLQS